MFNIDHFYEVLYTNLVEKQNLQGIVLKKFGKCDSHKDIVPYPETPLFTHENIYFYDQEPFSFSTKIPQNMYDVMRELQAHRWDLKYNIWATSECNNPLLDAFCDKNNLVKWYYFYHAFASIDWFRTMQYLPKVDVYQGASYISLNNLSDNSRVYRSLFVSKLFHQGLLGEGVVSYNIGDYKTNNFLTPHDKNLISKLAQHSTVFRIQKNDYNKDNASAEHEYNLWTSAFWHIVSETCFYEKTTHLTEKAFKPIVARQPFILLSTPGSLAYLRRYGFETFGSFIDESYDLETNSAHRLDKVVQQIKLLSSLTDDDKQSMYHSMLPILEHNFNHFYNNLYKICWDELTHNFEQVVAVLSEKQDVITKNPRLKELDVEISSFMSLPGRFGQFFRDKFKRFSPKD